MSACYAGSIVVAWKELFDPRTLRCTMDWRDEFGNADPVTLEIGFGNGAWLRQMAAANAERNYAGVELAGEYVREASRRAVRDKQTNIRLICGDARLLLPLMFDDASLAEVYVNFPDPWFKRRHKKRRLLNVPFLRMLSRKMAAGALLYVATDNAEYCDFTLQALAGVPAYTKQFEGHHLSAIAGYPSTKYERKWRLQGGEIFFLRYRNAANSAITMEEYLEAQNLAIPFNLIAQRAGNAPERAV